MATPIYYIDAFSDKLFSGNPAAVIFSQINDSVLMQNIASENNLSETAFIRKENGKLHIRWFAPSCEIDLCGHATLATAFVYFKYHSNDSSNIFEVTGVLNSLANPLKDTFVVWEAENSVANILIDIAPDAGMAIIYYF